MKRRRLITACTAICLTFSGISTFTLPDNSLIFAADTVKAYGDFEYSMSNETDGITITKYTGTAADVVVPDKINGTAVTEIGKQTFEGNAIITNVVLPENVRIINSKAFKDCSKLKSINMPEKLVKIGEFAFDCCSHLEKVEFGSSLNLIQNCAFQLCSAIEEMTIPGSVETVSEHSCNSMLTLKTLKFEEGVKVIEMDSFINAYSIESIYFPRSIEKIADGSVGFSYWYDDYTPIEGVAVYGYIGTEAQRYAKRSGFDFVPLNPEDIKFGDVNIDGAVDASDASMILAEYARVATKHEPTFTSVQKLKADADGDGLIDSTDASFVLAYYAYHATGGEGSLEDFLGKRN